MSLVPKSIVVPVLSRRKKDSEDRIRVIEKRFTPGFLAIYLRHSMAERRAQEEFAEKGFKRHDWTVQGLFVSDRFCFKNEKDFSFFITKFPPVFTVRVTEDGIWNYSKEADEYNTEFFD